MRRRRGLWSGPGSRRCRIWTLREKSSHRPESLVSVRRDDGTVAADPAEVRRLAVGFYSEVFTASTLDQQCSRVLLEDLPQLDELHLRDLDTALTCEEVTRAVFQLASGRAPGIDGLPADFCKALWETVGRDLFEVSLASYEAGAFPTSCQRVVLSLIPKKGDLCLLTNWRPVSLLCSDYQILSRCTANRLGEALGVVVDQSYCVPTPSIYNNLFLMRDLNAKSFNSDFGFSSLDQEKAFDRVGHEYLFATLRAFGFRHAFVSWVKLLYAGASCLIKVRGGLSLPVPVGRGIKKAAVWSGNSLITVSTYADDITVVIRHEQDVASLRDALQTYGLASSAKLNWSKSEALWCGGTDYPLPPLPGGVQWSRAGLKYLGVWLGNDEMKARNWEGVVVKVRARLSKYPIRVLVLNNIAVLRLQATQRLLYGGHCSWMDVACALLRMAGRLGLDRQLFSLRLEAADLGGLTPFYLAAIEAWQPFSFSRPLRAGPSLWTFEEPLFFNSVYPSVNRIPGGLRTSILRNGIPMVRHFQRGVDWVSTKQWAEMRGFIRAPGCAENVEILRSVVRRGRADCAEVALVFVDFAKAFDSVSHEHILDVLRRRQVDEHVMGVVRDLYMDVLTRVADGRGGATPAQGRVNGAIPCSLMSLHLEAYYHRGRAPQALLEGPYCQAGGGLLSA
ncbi:hypothetical protein NFI96_001421 [Prochilodus magdalenae]|nr:hypothetical protein NFI96_001421 [Prochilodus magdalenae]